VSGTGGRWGHLRYQVEHQGLDREGVEGGGVLGGSGGSVLGYLGMVSGRCRYRFLRGVNRGYELVSSSGHGVEYGGHVVR